jgi:hypothetical protein
MSAPPPVAVRGSLVGRVKAILMQPKSEWQVIDGEPATVGSIYMGYILLLAAIPAICGAVWMARYLPGVAAEYAVVRYVTGVISPFVLALIIDALAPSFGGQKNQIQALKVAAYASTAVWVSGIFLLIPGLGILAILGLYSLYLLYLGLPVLMKAPADRALGYTVVTIVAAFVLAIVVSYLTRAVFGGAYYPGYSGFNR